MPALFRAVTQPRVYRTLLVATLATSLAATAYAIGRLEPAPIAITTPPIVVPAPNVTVTPAPVTITPAPAPLPPPPAEPKPDPTVVQPRALTPKVDAACVIRPDYQTDNAEPLPTCAWDAGFPAVARDGSLVAVQHAPSGGPSDLYSLTIRFIDPITSRTVRDAVILTQDEASAFVYPDQDAAKAEKIQNGVRAKVARRVATVQKTLDTAKFRSLQMLGGWRENQEATEPPVARPTDRIYAEVAGSEVRIVDPKSASVLWRGDFSVAGPKQTDPTDTCGGWELGGIATWWDPETQTVLAASTHLTGGSCMCSDIESWSAQRF